MIYDCFTFFNELELLEIRLNELAGVVDKFVLVEATQTHTNKPKPLYYQENRARFSAFHGRIIHVVVDDMPQSDDAWVPENFQRNSIARGLTSCRPDDWILVSDLDEIPRAATLEKAAREISFNTSPLANGVHATLNSRFVKWVFHRGGMRHQLRRHHPFVWRFEQDFYRNFLNCRSLNPETTCGTKMMRFRDFSCAEEMRHSGYKIIKNGGWHFSWMGGVSKIQEKLAAYAHQERNRPELAEPQHIQQALDQGRLFYDTAMRHKFVPVDETFPSYVRDHAERFSGWIKPL